MKRSNHRPVRDFFGYVYRAIWAGEKRSARAQDRQIRRRAAREAIEAADPLWWCAIDPLLVHDPLVSCQSLFRRRAGLDVGTGPGRLP